MVCSTPDVAHNRHVVCHLVRKDSSTIYFDRVEITFVYCLTLMAEIVSERRGGNEST